MLPEMNTVMTLSTSHLAKSDRDILESLSKAISNLVYNTHYGFMIKTHWFSDENDIPAEFDGVGLSEQFLRIMKLSSQSNIYAVEFDCDGPTTDMFEEYEW